MDSFSPESMVRQNLLDRLLNSVKQVQAHFGAKQEIATESDARVSALCIEWEMVLSHGAKKPKPKNALRLTGRNEGVSLWPLAKLCLSTEDLQRFNRLEHVNSELGRGRAWLRAAINERTLENYMHTVLSQGEQLRKLYESHGFLLDQERSSMLPVMAAGLSSIIFSIPVDATYLNTHSRSVEVPAPSVSPSSSSHMKQVILDSQPPPVSRPRTPSPPSLQHSYQSFLPVGQTVPPLSESTPAFPPQLHAEEPDDDDVIAISAKGKKKKHKKSKSKPPQSSQFTSGSLVPVNEPTGLHGSSEGPEERAAGVQKESISSSSSHLSLDSTNEDGQAPMYVALATPSDLVSSEAMAAANATALVLSATSAPLRGDLPGDGNGADGEESAPTGMWSLQAHSVQGPTSVHQTLPADDEMRSAMLALSKMKDELELKNKKLNKELLELQGCYQVLEEELEASRQETSDIREAHAGQKQALERENDLLREQLKKYVGMVQAQRKETQVRNSDSLTSGTSDGVVSGGPVGVTTIPPRGDENETPLLQEDKKVVESLSEGDQKLQEMAEMYGELMELNERLHRNLADKDTTICTLVRSLRDASVELPVSAQKLPPAAVETKVLVDIWIPSVIKKGRGPEAFHVYQVFIRVKAVEWNIYRRYTEFREFHRQLQKYLPEIATFNFPPKKAIGNKSSQVVEDRRMRLQEYLRFVIKFCSSKAKQNIITSDITKETLVTMFPFFKEDFNVDTTPPPTQYPSYSGL